MTRVAPAAAPLLLLRLVVPGPPRTRKNNNRRIYRRVKGETREFVVPSEAATDYEQRVNAAVLALPAVLRRPFPLAADVHVCARFHVDRAGALGDLHGYMQSLADALEAKRNPIARVLANDRAIRSWDGSRVVVGSLQPHTDFTITLFTE